MAVVTILQKKSARNRAAHHLLRCLYTYTALFHFDYSAEHVAGMLNEAALYFYTAFFHFDYSAEHVADVLNGVADALSRGNTASFNSLIPQAAQTQVPISLVDLLITQQPDWGSTHWISLFGSTLPTR